MTPTLLAIRKNGKYGFCDFNGRILIEPTLDVAFRSVDAVAVAADVTGQVMIFDAMTLERRIPQGLMLDGFHFSFGLLSVSRNDRIGFINRNGQVVIEPRLFFAMDFDHLGTVAKPDAPGGLEQRMNRDGELLGPKYGQIRGFHPNGRCGGAKLEPFASEMVIINSNGERVGNRTFRRVWREHEGLIPVEFADGSSGWVDLEGNDLMRIRAARIGNNFESGVVPVEGPDYKWGLMDKEARWVVDPRFDYITAVGTNLYAIGVTLPNKRNSVWLADRNGTRRGSESFTLIHDFHDGIAKVSRVTTVHEDKDDETEFNYIDVNGRVLLEEWSFGLSYALLRR